MREILYRAISMARGEHWVYGQPRHYAHNPHTEKWTMYDPQTGIETDIVEETLGEYTGEIDKNGNKIFEGDIINTGHNLSEVRFGEYKHINSAETYTNGDVGFYLYHLDEVHRARFRNDILYFAEVCVLTGNIHEQKGGDE